MSEWTEGDVEAATSAAYAVIKELPMSADGTGHIADCGYDEETLDCACSTLPHRIARALLASGVVVPARVVEEAELALSRFRGAVAALADEWERTPEPPSEDYEGTTEGHYAFGEWLATTRNGKSLRALLTEGRDRAGEGAAFREGECAPRRCSCIGHVVPGVEHSVPCCDEPHVTAGEGAGS